MDRVDVRVLEARDDGPATQLDDPAARSDVRRDQRIRADRHDPAAAHGEGGRPGSGRVHRRDTAITQDEVGG